MIVLKVFTLFTMISSVFNEASIMYFDFYNYYLVT
jgi:hypothetical protein